MKLYYDQLHSHLKQELAPLYFVYGYPEILTINIKNNISETAKNRGFTVEKHYSDNNFDSLNLLNSLYTQDLFHNKRFIEIIWISEKIDKTFETFITEYFNNPPAETICLVKASKITKTAIFNRIISTINKNGVLIPAYPLSSYRIINWVKSRAMQLGVSLAPNEINLITSFAENDLQSIEQILLKLFLTFGSAKITRQDITTILYEQNNYNLPDFIKNLLSGNATKSLIILQKYKNQYAELPLLLWLIAKEIRNIIKLKKKKNIPVSNNNYANNYQVIQYQQASKRLNIEQLQAALIHLSQIDRVIKGVDQGNPMVELEKLILMFCGKMKLNSLTTKYWV